jgi:NAD-dependent dihydropyrimidine dehydrogenase PreA subunit
VSATEETAYKWVPVTSDLCTACGKCVEACPHNCLELVSGFAEFARADGCVSQDDCVEVCPHQGIEMDWVEMTGNRDVGLWCAAPPDPATIKPKGWVSGLIERLASVGHISGATARP